MVQVGDQIRIIKKDGPMQVGDVRIVKQLPADGCPIVEHKKKLSKGEKESYNSKRIMKGLWRINAENFEIFGVKKQQVDLLTPDTIAKLEKYPPVVNLELSYEQRIRQCEEDLRAARRDGLLV